MWTKLLARLPTTATAPFCPSEVQGSVQIPTSAPPWKKAALFLGPGLLVSVGYMDPGNWATDIEAGSRFGYGLLFVVLLSSLAAMWLQCISMRVGLITGRDLAVLSRERYTKFQSRALWILAEFALIATDVAEVLGAGLAFKLLLGCSLRLGIWLTVLDTIIVLGLKGKGFRRIEAIILGLIATIGLCYVAEIILVGPDWADVARGFVPGAVPLAGIEPWYLAIGILGATVMPHNLYLHSSIVHTRVLAAGAPARREALKLNTVDTVGSLTLAFLVNAAILILAGAAFHAHGQHGVTEIDEAHHLLDPLVGGSIAGWLFGIALLAAGQSSTFTGTIAGQIVMEGFLNWEIPCWQRRLITRGLALIPAYLGVAWCGEGSTGRLLVLSQVVLSLQLPFTIYPLLKFAADGRLMGEFRLHRFAQAIGWLLFVLISLANLVLVVQLMRG